MLSDVFALIAERKITEAMERGDFKYLKLKGQPLSPESLSGLPAELRMGDKILKNAGCLPRELELRDLLQACQDNDERLDLRKRLALATLNDNILAEKNLPNQSFHQYSGRVKDKLGL